MIRDQEPLLLALAEALSLLEHCTDDEIDPDIAVRGMENISHCLHALDAGDRLELARGLERIAAAASDEPFRTFVRCLPEILGFYGQYVEKAMIFCPRCYEQIEEDTVLCPTCQLDTTRDAKVEMCSAAELVRERRASCVSCGRQIIALAEFCRFCRTRQRGLGPEPGVGLAAPLLQDNRGRDKVGSQMIRNQGALLRALIEPLLLFGLYASDEVDPDVDEVDPAVAARGIERIASRLQALDASDRLELAKGL